MVDIYGNVYEIIVNYLFGGGVLSNNEELITIALASIASIFVFSIPFIIVWRIVKMISSI